MSPNQPPPAEAGNPDARGKPSGIAFAALLLGICGIIPLLGIPLALLGIILGIIALATRLPGKRMATTGIVVGIVGGLGVNLLLLVGGLLPGMGHPGRGHRNARCQTNLHAIGKAIAVYWTTSEDHFPLLWNAGDPNAALDANGANDVWAIQSTNSMSNLWLLIKEGMISIGTFHCPSDAGWMKRTETGRYGWTDLRQFSYGLHWPYGSDGSKSNEAALRISDLDTSFPIMAGRNPGGSVGAGRKPSNHPKDGTEVLSIGCSVSFYKNASDSNAGLDGDDIYVNGDGVAGGIPTSSTDTSITPVPSR